MGARHWAAVAQSPLGTSGPGAAWTGHSDAPPRDRRGLSQGPLSKGHVPQPWKGALPARYSQCRRVTPSSPAVMPCAEGPTSPSTPPPPPPRAPTEPGNSQATALNHGTRGERARATVEPVVTGRTVGFAFPLLPPRSETGRIPTSLSYFLTQPTVDRVHVYREPPSLFTRRMKVPLFQGCSELVPQLPGETHVEGLLKRVQLPRWTVAGSLRAHQGRV